MWDVTLAHLVPAESRKQGYVEVCVDEDRHGLFLDEVCERFMSSSYLEFVCVVEADLHRRDHPGLKQRTQDAIGHCVGDEMKVKRISPEELRGEKTGDVKVKKVPSGERKTVMLVRCLVAVKI